MTIDEAKAIVAAYESLLDHAIETLRLSYRRWDVNEDTIRLTFNSDETPALWWSEIDSHEYLARQTAAIDPRLLLLSAEDLEKEIEAFEVLEKERHARDLAAKADLEWEARQAWELATYAQLHAKYGPK